MWFKTAIKIIILDACINRFMDGILNSIFKRHKMKYYVGQKFPYLELITVEGNEIYNEWFSDFIITYVNNENSTVDANFYYWLDGEYICTSTDIFTFEEMDKMTKGSL